LNRQYASIPSMGSRRFVAGGAMGARTGRFVSGTGSGGRLCRSSGRSVSHVGLGASGFGARPPSVIGSSFAKAAGARDRFVFGRDRRRSASRCAVYGRYVMLVDLGGAAQLPTHRGRRAPQLAGDRAHTIASRSAMRIRSSSDRSRAEITRVCLTPTVGA
jgi:hypothetical protein